MKFYEIFDSIHTQLICSGITAICFCCKKNLHTMFHYLPVKTHPIFDPLESFFGLNVRICSCMHDKYVNRPKPIHTVCLCISNCFVNFTDHTVYDIVSNEHNVLSFFPPMCCLYVSHATFSPRFWLWH